MHANREQRNAYQRSWAAKNRDSRRSSVRLSRYGVSKEQFSQMLDNQAGLCAICCEPMKPADGQMTQRDTCVEHNHQTGKIRGLTCRACNSMIAHANEDVLRLQAGVSYLQGAL